MAALVKFLRPSGEPVYVNADHVITVMEAPAGRAMLYMAAGAPSLEVDSAPALAAEVLNSAASGFTVTNSYSSLATTPGLEQTADDETKEDTPG